MSVDTVSVADSQDDEPVSNIIQLPANAKSFEASGVKYYVETSLSIGRYKHYQRMEQELGFNVNFSGLVSKMVSAYNALNERRDADAAVLMKEMLEGTTYLKEKTPIALYVATLFINRADEDPAEWSQKIAEEKLEHWKNIDSNFFLAVALGRVNNFAEAYRTVATMLEKVGEIKEKASHIMED